MIFDTVIFDEDYTVSWTFEEDGIIIDKVSKDGKWVDPLSFNYETMSEIIRKAWDAYYAGDV